MSQPVAIQYDDDDSDLYFWKISPENSGTNEFPLSKLFRNLENIFIPTGYLAVCRLLFE